MDLYNNPEEKLIILRNIVKKSKHMPLSTSDVEYLDALVDEFESTIHETKDQFKERVMREFAELINDKDIQVDLPTIISQASSLDNFLSTLK